MRQRVVSARHVGTLGVYRCVMDAIECVMQYPRVRRRGPDVRMYAPRCVSVLVRSATRFVSRAV